MKQSLSLSLSISINVGADWLPTSMFNGLSELVLSVKDADELLPVFS